MADGPWEVYIANEVLDWIDGLDHPSHSRVVQAIDTLAGNGPGLGRPLVDTIHGSSIPNLKELRPGSVRILFAFDPWRSAILLVAGDKAGRWKPGTPRQSRSPSNATSDTSPNAPTRRNSHE